MASSVPGFTPFGCSAGTMCTTADITLGGGTDLERVALDRLQPPFESFAELGQGGQAAPVALDGDHPGSGAQQRPRKSARPRSHFVDRLAFQRAGNPRDPVEKLLVEKEILAERFRRAETVARYDLAQRRQGHASASRRAHSPAVRIAAIIAPGSAESLPAISKAVP